MQHIEDMIKQVDYSRGSDLEIRLGEQLAAMQAGMAITARGDKRKVNLRDLETQEASASGARPARDPAGMHRRAHHSEMDPPAKNGPRV